MTLSTSSQHQWYKDTPTTLQPSSSYDIWLLAFFITTLLTCCVCVITTYNYVMLQPFNVALYYTTNILNIAVGLCWITNISKPWFIKPQ
jgi:hypothetical protein